MNPQEQVLMNLLKAKKPNEFNSLQQMLRSGKNPLSIIRGLYSSGRISDSQLNDLQKSAKNFGINITDSQIRNIKEYKQISADIKKHKGWF